MLHVVLLVQDNFTNFTIMADDPKEKKATPVAYAPLTPVQKTMWNGFLDFMEKQGLKGNAALDNRDTNLGQYYLNKYKSITPGFSLTYQDVPRVQADLQSYRQNLINQYKSGKIAPDSSIKDPETDIMPNLSKVDGWLGSLTSSHRFPVAQATTADGQTQNFGTDVAKYDAQRLATKQP